mgnify:FL=1
MAWSMGNFSNEKMEEAKKGFQPLEPGKYDVFIVAIDPYHRSSKKGTPGIEMQLLVRDDVEQKGKGRKIFETIYITDNPKTQARAGMFFTALGIEDPSTVTPEDVKDLALGQAIQVELEINKYTDSNGNEKANNRVTFMGFFPPSVEGTASEEQLVKTDEEPKTLNDDPFAGNEASMDDDEFPM